MLLLKQVPWEQTHTYLYGIALATKLKVTPQIGFTKSVAATYAKENIRANVIAPALVETPMAKRAASNSEILDFITTKQPLEGGRIGTPSDLDGAVLFFLTGTSRFVTGQVLAIDGGWTVSEGQYR